MCARLPFIALVLAAIATASAAAEAQTRYRLRNTTLEAARADGVFALHAKLQRKPPAKTLQEGGGYSLLASVQAPAGNDCSDVIFRNGFD